jgi:hypothetical protein
MKTYLLIALISAIVALAHHNGERHAPEQKG